MVHAMIDIKEHTNRILNIIKAKYGLRDKSHAIDIMAVQYEEVILEPEFRPEFIEEMRHIHKEKSIPVKDFAARFGLKKDVQS